MSFTQIAKLVGDRWQKLDPTGKEPFESQANSAKERYNIQLSAYKKTDSYKEYVQYLAEFKAKHGGVGGQSDQKKPKLETGESSAGSVSGRSGDLMSEYLQPVHGHSRGGSISSIVPSNTGPASPIRGPGHLSLQHTSSRTPGLSQRGQSPPGTARDPRAWRGPPAAGMVGQMSNQSSLSEGSMARSDSDPLVRTASLSLSTPPTGTPPLPLQTDSVSMGHDPRRPRMPGPPPSLPSYGSSSYSQTLPSPATSDSSWRGRPSEIRSYLDIAPASMQPPSYAMSGPTTGSSISLPPLAGADRLADLQYRTLPLPRTSPTQQPGYIGGARFSETSNPFTAASAQGGPPRPESVAKSPLDRSESDNVAASTLAGLATGSAGSTPAPTPTPGSGLGSAGSQPPSGELPRWPHR
jgi:hypothetical protein